MKVRTARDCFIDNVYRTKGTVFEYNGVATPYLTPVTPPPANSPWRKLVSKAEQEAMLAKRRKLVADRMEAGEPDLPVADPIATPPGEATPESLI